MARQRNCSSRLSSATTSSVIFFYSVRAPDLAADIFQRRYERTVIDNFLHIQRLRVIRSVLGHEDLLLVGDAIQQDFAVLRPERIRSQANHVWWRIGGFLQRRERLVVGFEF